MSHLAAVAEAEFARLCFGLDKTTMEWHIFPRPLGHDDDWGVAILKPRAALRSALG